MKPRRLLAKSLPRDGDPPPEIFLPGHTGRVITCARLIYDEVGLRALRAVGLPQEWGSRLKSALVLAAAWHDLGKANSEFDRMIRGDRTIQQAVRHELVSLLLLVNGPLTWVREAAEGRDALVAWSALVAAVGHHAKFSESTEPKYSDGREVAVYLDHVDFSLTLKPSLIALGLESRKLQDVSWRCRDRWCKDRDLLGKIVQAQEYLDDTAPTRADDCRFAALVRLLTVAADVAGSAIPRSDKSPTWVREALSTRLACEDLDDVIRSSLKGREPHEFQRELQTVDGGVTLVSVGCGGGKTTGAYMWARHNAAGRKLLFCYPTTGTVTQGFLDYLQDVGGAGLHHSRAAADIVDLHLSEGLENVGSALVSLRAWPAKVLACTVDTVLGALHFNTMGVFSSPVIVGSAFVFDEIHLYDDRMFGLLLRFLELFPNAPTLLMTASLQPVRLAQLRRRVPHLREVSNAVSEAAPRYCLRPEVLEGVPWDRVGATLHAGGKVLIISNRVNDAIYRSYEAERRGLRPITYHSRFRYEDRRRRHEEVVDAFRSNGPALAITTQVAEVSLDISADLLVTDVAPAEALIQRMGRLNRYLTSPVAEAHAIQAEPLPYAAEDLAGGAAFWNACAGLNRVVSQADLASELARMVGLDTDDRLVVSLIDGKFASERSSIREPGYTRTAFLDVDLPRLRRAIETHTLREEFVRCAIPIPTDWPQDGRCLAETFLDSYPVVNTGVVRYTQRHGAISLLK